MARDRADIYGLIAIAEWRSGRDVTKPDHLEAADWLASVSVAARELGGTADVDITDGVIRATFTPNHPDEKGIAR